MPLNDEMIAPDGRRIIGKKYISDADASKSGACKACLEYAGRIFKWPEEKDKMPVLPRHPNCKCHYEDVYENGNQKNKKIYDVLMASNKNINAETAKIIESLLIAANDQMKKYLRKGNEVYLYFNGRYLFSNTGHLILDAVSGKPSTVKSRIKSINKHYVTEEKELTFDYSKKRQAIRNEGGLPEGIYLFRCFESGSLQNGNLKKHLLKRCAWGTFHWILCPLPQTNTYQRARDSFTIHGGNNFGSAGCIDLQKNDVILKKYLHAIHQVFMYLFVKYNEEQVTISEIKEIGLPVYP